jgi:hypothetical protein
MATLDLNSIIRPNVTRDLYSALNAGYFGIIRDLPSYVTAIEPVNLNSIIHGFAIRDLPASINAVYGPNDIQATISPIPALDLKSSIAGFKALNATYNLRSVVEGYYAFDLSSSIQAITPKDLNSYINSVGKVADLGASIVPMTILMSKIFSVALLEHKDLPSFINCGCRQSGYIDLNSSLYALMKLDLQSTIIGWFGDYAKNVRDLKSYINAGDALVIDTLDIRFNAEKPYTEVDLFINTNKNLYKVVDILTAAFSNKAYVTLGAYIYGHPVSKNLGSYINAQVQSNFNPTPEWIKPKTTEVFINLTRFEQRWQRFVDLMFTSGINGEHYYFYVPGDEKIYKVDKKQQWTLWVTGYDKDPDNMIEHINIKRKFIFNLSKYTSMDQAIKDMMSRVAEPRITNLKNTIIGILPTHAELTSEINPIVKYTWTKNLNSAIIGS